jgi:DNA repair exonuclease SbcCD ATPase subunit
LEICNMFAYRGTVSVRLDDGIMLLSGLNASGKTSVLNAILFVIYGNLCGLKSILHSADGVENGYVKLCYTVGGNPEEFVRFYDRKTTGKKIKALIGKKNVFTNSHFMNLGPSRRDYTDTSYKDKTEMLGSIVDTKMIDDAKTKVKNIIKLKDMEIRELERRITKIEKSIDGRYTKKEYEKALKRREIFSEEMKNVETQLKGLTVSGVTETTSDEELASKKHLKVVNRKIGELSDVIQEISNKELSKLGINVNYICGNDFVVNHDLNYQLREFVDDTTIDFSFLPTIHGIYDHHDGDDDDDAFYSDEHSTVSDLESYT